MPTDVTHSLSFQDSRSRSAERTVTLAPPPPPPPSPHRSASSARPTEDRLEVARDERAGAGAEDARAAAKMVEALPPEERRTFTDILQILSENAPSVFKSIRAIIAERAGLSDETNAALDPELLARTMKLATGAPNPAQRMADVARGVGFVAPPGQNDFLEAAGRVLAWEQSAAARAVSTGPTPAAPAPSPAPRPTVAVDPVTGTYQPSGGAYSVEVNFDLFFSVSARSSIRGGANAAGAFHEATRSLDAAFGANFSVRIAGQFLDLADAAETVDPAVLESFSRAVQGLAGLDEDALDRFFSAADDLFTALEDGYGLGGTALDGVAAEVKATAQGFFEAVGAASRDVLPGLKLDQLFELPAGLDANGTTDLLALLEESLGEPRPGSGLGGLLEALTSGANARALQSPPPPPDLWNSLQVTPTAA